MTRLLLRRGLVVVAAAAVFAATASGSALAWSGTVRQVALSTPVPTVATVSERGGTAQSASMLGVTTADAAEQAATEPASQVRVTSSAPTARPKPTSTSAAPSAAPSATPRTTTPPSAPRTITIAHYVDAPGSQAQVDSCHLVLWTHSPLWLAGHNWCGYQWMAFVPTGTTVVVPSGAAAGRYVVTGHLTLHRQSGSLPSLTADLVLQTCVGSSTGLTLLHRV